VQRKEKSFELPLLLAGGTEAGGAEERELEGWRL
jgi:hypothetical protein